MEISADDLCRSKIQYPVILDRMDIVGNPSWDILI